MTNLLAPHFQDAEAARTYLEGVRWPEGPVCPHCGSMKRYELTAREGSKSPVRAGVHKCADCRKQYSVTVGTVFEKSKIGLNKWLLAVYMLCSSKKGFSAHQLHRSLGVTYKTAWFMMHRIREAMKDGNGGLLGGQGKVVEADETFWGNTRSKKVPKGKAAYHHKEKVFALVERQGRVRSFHVPKVNAATLMPILRKQVDPQTDLMTDEHHAYTKLSREFASHQFVTHHGKEYVRGLVYTNTIEGVFCLLKRGLNGIYHHVSPAHLHRYLVEFDFRYNNRKVTDWQRATEALKGIEGKRLYYRDSASV